MKHYDAIVIGAGHNGLTCACYLAKSGMSVLVVERNAEIGGMTGTRELVAPGYHTDIHATGYQLANLSSAPDELRLADFGLEFIAPNTCLSKAFDDHSCLSIMANIEDTCTSIAQYSQRDADTWASLITDYLAQKDALKRTLESPPRSPAETLAQLEGQPEGPSFIRFRSQTVRSWATETFASEQMRALIADFAAHAGFAPDDAGGAEFAYLYLSVIQDTGNKAVKGGMGRLPAALRACLEHLGGEVRIGAPVSQIRVENGTATGVRLADGSVISGGCVVSSAHPRHLILEMLSETALPAHVVNEMKRYELGTSQMGIYLALSAPVTYAAGDAAFAALQIQVMPNTVDELAQAFCDIRANRLPERPSVFVVNEASTDPSRVPVGKSSLKVIVVTVPYQIDWSTARTSYAQFVIDQLAAGPLPDLKQKIIATAVMSPTDYEADVISAVRGTVTHGAMVAYQQGAMRPTLAMGQYRGPVGNLYLCGAGNHPGPGVSMMPGRNAAQVVLGGLS